MNWQFKDRPNKKHLILLKNKLVTEPIRAHPDFNKPFKLYKDASDTELGAMLTQDDEEGKEKIIAYEARRLSVPE